MKLTFDDIAIIRNALEVTDPCDRATYERHTELVNEFQAMVCSGYNNVVVEQVDNAKQPTMSELKHYIIKLKETEHEWIADGISGKNKAHCEGRISALDDVLRLMNGDSVRGALPVEEQS